MFRMIIKNEEVLQGMQTDDKKIGLKTNIKSSLAKVHTLFNQLNEAAERQLFTQLAKTEGEINKVLLNTLNNHPLVDLETFGYQNVNEESVQYLFVPKEEKVEGYVVDIVTVFFKYTEDNSEVSVTLPFYLVTEGDKEYIIAIDTQSEDVMSVESLTIFN